jgi:3-hydroxyisobutyrate dehydrogenase
MARVAFIGLGQMGGGMAPHLVKAGQEVVAFDLNPAALAKAADAGCRPAQGVEVAVGEADAVVTMLPTGQDVRKVYLEQILPNAPASAMLIDSSTIEVDIARAVASEAEAQGRRFADAPVSGGAHGAAAGTLTFMVGCREQDFPEIEQILQPMGRRIVRAGGAGAGQAAKICNNMALGVQMLGVCEAFALAERLGLDPKVFFDIANTSSAQSWSLSTNSPWPGTLPSAPSSRGYEGGFLTALMLKDLKLAQEAAAKNGASTPMGAHAEGMFALFDRLGYGRKDFSAILQLLRGRLEDLG